MWNRFEMQRSDFHEQLALRDTHPCTLTHTFSAHIISLPKLKHQQRPIHIAASSLTSSDIFRLPSRTLSCPVAA